MFSWLVCVAVIVFVPGVFALLAGLDVTVAAAITALIGLCVLVAGVAASLL